MRFRHGNTGIGYALEGAAWREKVKRMEVRGASISRFWCLIVALGIVGTTWAGNVTVTGYVVSAKEGSDPVLRTPKHLPAAVKGPIEGARVTLMVDGQAHQATTDAEGRFTLAFSPSASSMKLTISDDWHNGLGNVTAGLDGGTANANLLTFSSESTNYMLVKLPRLPKACKRPPK